MKINSLTIVGGGSAGWMTATTFCQCLNYDITLVESPNIPIAGVGESTLQHIIEWLDLVRIREKEPSLVKETNATLKHSIKFVNFLSKDSGAFHYPFGNIQVSPEIWWNLYLHGENLSYKDYALNINPLAAMAEKGKINRRIYK